MNKRMTAETLEAIRKRAEAASEGPWELEDDGNGVWNHGGNRYLGGVVLDVEDAEFIVEARTDIPALLAEVGRLRKLLNDLIGTVYSYGTPGETVYEKAEEVDELL